MATPTISFLLVLVMVGCCMERIICPTIRPSKKAQSPVTMCSCPQQWTRLAWCSSKIPGGDLLVWQHMWMSSLCTEKWHCIWQDHSQVVFKIAFKPQSRSKTKSCIKYQSLSFWWLSQDSIPLEVWYCDANQLGTDGWVCKKWRHSCHAGHIVEVKATVVPIGTHSNSCNDCVIDFMQE